ncbi:MAG: exosortase B, partial [Gammaproteobacteria bacterium]
AVLYGPTVYGLANGVWQSEDQAHGPLILAVVLWLAWSGRDAFSAATQPRPLAGWLWLLPGLLLYAVGRSQDILILEIGSAIPVLVGCLLALVGPAAVRRLWFPLLFLIFLIPLPGFLVDAVTGPLKQHASALAAQLLFAAGYPIARAGVLLHLGPYQLLVADACSGMHSIYSLAAVGLFYLHLMGYKNRLRLGLLVLAIVPIAFLANTLRVVTLALITFHMGDAAAQGYLHGLAGISLYLFALAMLLALDALLGLLPGLREPRRQSA